MTRRPHGSVYPDAVPESLHRHKRWLGILDCTCPHVWASYGRVYGQPMGEGWQRASTKADCPKHGWLPPVGM